jgi:thymidylate synthase ThyX
MVEGDLAAGEAAARDAQRHFQATRGDATPETSGGARRSGTGVPPGQGGSQVEQAAPTRETPAQPDPLSLPERRVFAVLGMLPEPGGYAVAKFSRSARPFADWARALTQAGAERFYEQFYFQYGHASIADLAHLTLVLEHISIVAAIEVLDEPLVDAQESSTRYQDFTPRRYYVPPEVRGSPLEPAYRAACDQLFATYTTVHETLTAYYHDAYAAQRPPGLSDEAYRRTVRARAFDVARYLLPASTYTGLGYLASARTLEQQIVRLLSHPLAELRELGAALKEAATTQPAWNPQAEKLAPLLAALEAEVAWARKAELLAALRELALTPVPAAPTLIRYTAPSAYLERTYAELAELAQAWLPAQAPDTARGVDLVEPHDQELELVATLLYRVTPYSYRQVLTAVRDWSPAQRAAVLELAYRHRGPHDPPLRETRTGYELLFDLCLDCGAFRDLHRHRRLVQVVQPFWGLHGYDEPPEVARAGLAAAYRAAMAQAGAVARALNAAGCPHYYASGRAPAAAEAGAALALPGQYALPLGYRRRVLLKMDAAELAYIVETRTRPAGHFSYREIAFAMYQAFAQRYPRLARYIRATDPREERFFER